MPMSLPPDSIEGVDGAIPPCVEDTSVPLDDIGGTSFIPSTPSHIIPTRASSRVSKQPSYLRDYHCHLLQHKSVSPSTLLYSLNIYLNYD